MSGTDPTEDAEELTGGQSGQPSSTGARLEETATALDRVTGGRVGGLLFIGVLGLPLGCAFVGGFIALIVVFGGAVALVGLQTAPLANLIALAAALIGAFAFVVLVYRKVILRVPWLRRMINR
jgi:hypothetical protein